MAGIGAVVATPPSRFRRVVGELLPLTAMALLLAVVAAAFVVPWLPSNPVQGSDLDRYNPARDGAAYLSLERDAGGAVSTWQSENLRRVPGLRAAAQWRSGPAGALDAHISRGDALDTTERSRRLEHVDALEVAVREAGPDGVHATDLYSVLDADGQWLLAVHDVTAGTENVLDPPLLVRPRDLPLGRAWESEGALGAGGATYRFTGEVMDQGPRETPAGAAEDCIEVLERFSVTVGGEVVSESSTRSWSCADVGAVVEATDFDAEGTTTAIRSLVATDRVRAHADDLPDLALIPQLSACAAGDHPGPTCDGGGVAGDPSTWILERLGSAHRSFSADEATIPPQWIPSDPPLVLAAARAGDLVAFDATTGDVRWRFHPGGTIQGPPTYAEGRILFGATDKRLYALDTRGLFLWAHRTSDSIATRPLVVEGRVIIGSEDRDVHAVDLATGAPLWRIGTGGPIASSPALVDGRVAIGSDDGALRLLDPTDGTVQEVVDVGGPVVAPVAAADRLVIAGTTGGSVVAVDVNTAEVTWQAEVGGAVRVAPAVADGRVHVVDDSGAYTVLDVEDGTELLTTGGSFVGAPLLLEHGVALTQSGGRIVLLDEDGEELGGWDAADASGVGDASPAFALGPTIGGGRLWTVDRGGVVRSVGPPPTVGAVADLTALWLQTLTDEPFSSAGSPPLTTPVAWQGRALGIDGGGNVYATDPGTGASELLGSLDGLAAYAAPVVAGDTLLVPGQDSLRALRLPDLAPLWEAAGVGATARPPVVAGDLVLYASGAMGEDGTGEVRLAALDVVSGGERWQAPLGPVPLAGGVVVVDDLVIGGTPLTARDLGSGEIRWESSAGDEATLGSPGLSQGGTTVVVATLAFDGSDRSTLRAVDALTGDLRWEVDLGEAALDLTEAVAVAGDVVVVPTLDGALQGHDLVDGAELWRFQGPAPIFGNVSVESERVWLALENAQVLALDVRSGAVVGRFTDLDFPLESQSRAQRPGIVGDRVVVAFGYLLVGFDAASLR